ncbi:hypothetical protein Tco_0987793 [Tanacetum coccineum]
MSTLHTRQYSIKILIATPSGQTLLPSPPQLDGTPARHNRQLRLSQHTSSILCVLTIVDRSAHKHSTLSAFQHTYRSRQFYCQRALKRRRLDDTSIRLLTHSSHSIRDSDARERLPSYTIKHRCAVLTLLARERLVSVDKGDTLYTIALSNVLSVVGHNSSLVVFVDAWLKCHSRRGCRGRTTKRTAEVDSVSIQIFVGVLAQLATVGMSYGSFTVCASKYELSLSLDGDTNRVSQRSMIGYVMEADSTLCLKKRSDFKRSAEGGRREREFIFLFTSGAGFAK